MDWIQTKTILFRRFSPGARHLIGVSGGRDSVTLLHHLVDVGYKKLIICHLNHELRGRSSNADARFVEKLAAKYEPKPDRDVRAVARKSDVYRNRRA
jgi:tRNA(Ile)-lysidine synthase